MEVTKINLRPIFAKDLTKESVGELELFQNETLRPILKLQHDLLIAVFKNYLVTKKANFQNKKEEDQILFIENSITKDLALKNQCIGLVLGMFTIYEFKVYESRSSEYNKRIISMLKKRLIDSIPEIKA